MAATFVPAPPTSVPLVDANGVITRPWRTHFHARHQQAGGAVDKIDAAHAAALAAVPQTTKVVGSGGLHSVADTLDSDVGLTLYKVATTVAMLPTAGNATGDWAYATNGRKPGEGVGAGTGVPCFWSAGNWIAVTSGAAVTA